ncbi:MAG: chloride channel protein [Steroidobacteraceae bacterium]
MPNPSVSAPFAAEPQVPHRKTTPHSGDPLRDFTADLRLLVLSAMALVVGTGGAASAWVLLHLIDIVTNIAYYGRFSVVHVTPVGTPFGVFAALVPVAGCLVIGLMARYGSERIRGHGIPEAIEAILIGRSRIDAKVAVLKPLSSAISIGTGGPFGAEGPIIMTGGALGSLFAQMFRLSPAERKTLLVAGASAGMSATFGTPIAAILLAVELLLFEWKPRSFVPVAVASIVAAVWRPWLLGPGPLFPMEASHAVGPAGLLLCAALGVIGGVCSGGLTQMVYRAEDLFQRLPIHWMWWPALGGVVIGIGGLISPHSLGVGYDNIGALLRGTVDNRTALGLMVVKSIIWAVALGSGTSGGVLAPLLIMGGVVGRLVGNVMPVGDAAFWALLGMAAMMGGTMRAPLTAMLFALELTHDYNALLPLAVTSATAYATTVLLLKRSILTEKIARRGYHLTREYSVDPFQLMRVQEIMATPVDTLPAEMPVAEVVKFFTTPDSPRRHKSYPVVEPSGRVVGLVSRTDALAWMMDGHRTGTLAEQLAGRNLVLGYEDEIVGVIADRMAETQIGRLPILRREDSTLAGLVARRDILRVRATVNSEERDREALIHLRAFGRSRANTARQS